MWSLTRVGRLYQVVGSTGLTVYIQKRLLSAVAFLFHLSLFALRLPSLGFNTEFNHMTTGNRFVPRIKFQSY